MNRFEPMLENYRQMIESKLESLTNLALPEQAPIADAMRYSLLGGGKRVRAVLALEVCRALGASPEKALLPACAVEMVHAYSLIHDDLPCMDDDDLRRGKLTSHKAFGEAMAVLAGDGLLTLAFETLSSAQAIETLGAGGAIGCVGALSHASGAHGMLGGQVIDVLFENAPLLPERHNYMVSLKTAALIGAAAQCGAIAANASAQSLHQAGVFAEKLGIAFQITDDLLDVLGDEKLIGKKINSDEKHHKNTFVSLYGVEKAAELAAQYHAEAIQALERLTDDSEFLLHLVHTLSKRSF